MNENLKAFLARVSGDEQLLARLKAAQEYDEIFALAKELDMKLTLADIEPQSDELSEDELTAIHGGTDQQNWADFDNCSGGNGQQDCFCAAGGGGKKDENGDECVCIGYGQGSRGGNNCYCPLVGVGNDDSI